MTKFLTLLLVVCAIPIVSYGLSDSHKDSLNYLEVRCQDAYLSGNIQRLSSSLNDLGVLVEADEWANDNERKEYLGKYFTFISDLYYLQGKYAEALTVIDSAITYSCFQSAETITNLYVDKAQSQFMLQDFPGAAVSLKKAIDAPSDSTYAVYSSAYALSLAYSGKFEDAQEVINESSDSYFIHFLSDWQIQERERRKAKIQILKAESFENPTQEDYKDAITIYRSYFKHKKIDIEQNFSSMSPSEREGFWLTQRQFIVDSYRLGEFAPDFVFDVALFNKSLLLQFSAKNSKYKGYSWQDVRKGLPQNSAAIEFVQYRCDSTVNIAAVVVTKDCKSPYFIHLFKTSDILGYVLENKMTVSQAITAESSTAKNVLYSNEFVKSAIWNDQLISLTSNCKDIFFSADGFLHQLAIEYLYPMEKSPLIHRLTSTRSICKGCIPVKLEDASALICGDINFQTNLQSQADDANDSLAYEGLACKNIYIGQLDGSRNEIDSISAIRSCNKDCVIRHQSATESAFKNTAGKFNILHVSTHGIFNGMLNVPVEEIMPHVKDGTMSQSVLFFSGSNAKLHDSTFTPVGWSDGIISARELSDMDLTNVKLCVLAACQTGLGDVTADGVYGIQRGLKNAGAGALILSLWSVNDKATSIMMTRLYEHIEEGLSIHAAFEKARKDLTVEHKVTTSRYSVGRTRHIQEIKKYYFNQPFYRNAFILIDDIQ